LNTSQAAKENGENHFQSAKNAFLKSIQKMPPCSRIKLGEVNPSDEDILVAERNNKIFSAISISHHNICYVSQSQRKN